ncbi:sugar phosphate isomerase/epimerase [Salinisphaera sp. Q1T1-3]|uniref:sugar phosphate isomerase/epimerase family protein n=1 Tax=Salinisphaera sp. Q1T1-3 TaxID=2321229 RepID=UPI000E75D0B3|nr:sugar phosphate isomerase/epimerase family protein [Salinisphaera sp. Q1T1-3]RJS92397.1 sugar phosphate isomerase/epimerase [Salinisphaera sp. Q1T1-3]
MPYTAQDWLISAALLQFPGTLDDGRHVNEADVAHWRDVFAEVRDAGFSDVDLFDGWVRPGDLSSARLTALKEAADDVGVGLPAISVVRSSVIDAANGQANLDYSHRTLEAAAALGSRVVSVGLHQALTPAQKAQLWFWTVEGYKDPDEREAWDLAVARLRELGKHAEELGLILSLEMYEDTYLGTADSSVALVEAIDHPCVGLNPDMGNLIRLHRPIENWEAMAEKIMPYANYWHVKNYQRDEDIARDMYVAMPAPLESGLISYRKAFQIAIANGFQGVICCEHYGGDGLSVSASNQRYLREQVLPRSADYALGESRVRQN